MQAIANETGINFISVKGPELLNMASLIPSGCSTACQHFVVALVCSEIQTCLQANELYCGL